jgi:hypothetical protein
VEANHKKILKAIVLELRHMLEGYYNGSDWHAGDLEQRLNALGVWRDRSPLPADELAGLSDADRDARKVVDAYLKLRDEAGVRREEAVAEFVRETAYTWANRLLALRCMESRDLIDEVILQKDVYGGRSLEHNRLAQRNPELCAGDDDGLFVVLSNAFIKRAEHLPLLFDPKAPGVALNPSVAAVKRSIALLSGTEAIRGQEPATSDVFRAPDAFGWAYQYWNTEEKDRVFERVRTEKGTKIEGADIIPATQLYTEPYMVKFLVQNSLGATWARMNPGTKLIDVWDYYVKNADHATVQSKRVQELTFLDPACGSGHFLLEAFDLFYAMYEEEGEITEPVSICRSVLEHNLYGIDIDERACQITEAALWMKASERTLQQSRATLPASFTGNVVATNLRLPRDVDHLKSFLKQYPEDTDLGPALEMVFRGLQSVDELGSLLQIERPVESKLRQLQLEQETRNGVATQGHLYMTTPVQGELPLGITSFDDWKARTIARVQSHFATQSETVDLTQAFFNRAAGSGLRLFNLLARRYDVVAANPPYMGSRQMGATVKSYVKANYPATLRDLCVTFVGRACQLTVPGGFVAMVTQQSWLYSSSFEAFRHSPEQTGALDFMSVQTVAKLGEHAFAEGAAGAVVAMFTLKRQEPSSTDQFFAVLLSSFGNSDEKDNHLKHCIRGQGGQLVYRGHQRAFERVPGAPLVFWMPPEMLNAFELPHVESIDAPAQGLKTSDNSRFVRFGWELPTGSRWSRFCKGEGFRRWTRADWSLIDWESNGVRLKLFNSELLDGHWSRNITNTDKYFRPALVYTYVARGKLAVREIPGDSVVDAGSPVIVIEGPETRKALLGYLNSRPACYFARLLSQNLFNMTGVRHIPVPRLPESVIEHATSAVTASRALNQGMITSSEFSESLHQAPVQSILLAQLEQMKTIAEAELAIEKSVLESLNLTPESQKAIYDEVGLPLSAAGGEQETRLDLELLRAALEKGLARGIDDADGEEDDDDDDEDPALVQSPLPSTTLFEHIARSCNTSIEETWSALRTGIQECGWTCGPELRRIATDQVSLFVFRAIGLQSLIWSDSAIPSNSDGVLVLSISGGNAFKDTIQEQIENIDLAVTQNLFHTVMGSPVKDWLENSFFKHHVAQFGRRPIVWQLQSLQSGTGPNAIELFVSARHLGSNSLSRVQSQFVRPNRQRYETELRSIESIPQEARSGRQQERLTELMDLIAELRAFDQNLEDISRLGFGPEKVRPLLRQYAVDDATLCLKAKWLQKLSSTIKAGPLATWCSKADSTKLHQSLAKWIADTMLQLRHHCSAVGPAAPKSETLEDDPTSESLAFLITKKPDEMVQDALKLGCMAWWRPLDETVFAPLRAQIKVAKDELKVLKAEDYSIADDPFKRKKEIEARTKELKENVKRWERDLKEKTATANKLRNEIMAWECSEARGWETWLAAQPMYDAISSLDGVRKAPRIVADWIAQESAYVPDINDGVRVNIAPLQKARILAADVLAAKDVDKAIADRAEWRADERRWCREGKLPQPGWWPMEKTNGSGQK